MLILMRFQCSLGEFLCACVWGGGRGEGRREREGVLTSSPDPCGHLTVHVYVDLHGTMY